MGIRIMGRNFGCVIHGDAHIDNVNIVQVGAEDRIELQDGTIDDRAAQYAGQHREMYCLSSATLMEAAYHQGATDQREIDTSEKSRRELITRFEILRTMFDNSKHEYCSFEKYALKNWDNVDMDYFFF